MEEIEIEELKEQLLTAVEKRDRQKVIEIFDTVPNIDIAEAVEDVDDVKTLLYIFKVVNNEYAAELSDLWSVPQWWRYGRSDDRW